MMVLNWNGIHPPRQPGCYEVHGHWQTVNDELIFIITAWFNVESLGGDESSWSVDSPSS